MERAAELRVALVVMVVVVLGGGGGGGVVVVEGQSWCVAISNTNNQALQTALDYACGSGADCTAIQANGVCYQPNTVQSHASYAFNSYYQHMGQAIGSCIFAGTATISTSDPSYGSCVYPSSPSVAGGNTSTTTPTSTTPSTTTTPSSTTPIYGLGPTSSFNTNRAAFRPSTTIVLPSFLLLLLSLLVSPM
ncbi:PLASMODESMATA CALLOSE-BINDING PROTEIN 3-like [Telopea speciosissima]|uniref:PLASMODESMATA CALLOSE-BINDING PROTEIN 3-like n=1 Tax=Telopea speciosissima TaxID=54955 RepID=UPI001CC62C45|nr:PLASMODESMATA CALLOSE-BINDING PROTEIN 3-like [Telopea speciosissima]